MINYGLTIKGISTHMLTVWHVDKYKIPFIFYFNYWTNGIPLPTQLRTLYLKPQCLPRCKLFHLGFKYNQLMK